MKLTVSLAVIATCLSLNAGTGRAAALDLKACESLKDPSDRISACTGIAEDAAGAPEDRAKALLNRGQAYQAKGDNDRAIADFDQALLLAPGSARALLYRGLSYANKLDHDRAIRDYTDALAGESLDDHVRELAYNNRG